MADNVMFNQDQIEFLQEAMNIAYGRGTAAIADIIESFAKMAVPEIKIIEAKSIKSFLANKNFDNQKIFLITQNLNGDIIGENIFLMGEESAIKLADEFKLKNSVNETLLSGIISEIANILSTTTIGQLAEMLGSESYFEPPEVKVLDSLDKIDENSFIEYKQIIAISTILEFEEQKIYGRLMLLITEDSVEWMQRAIDSVIGEMEDV